MLNRLVLRGLIGVALLSLSFNTIAVTYSSYTINWVRPGADRPCTLFQLNGVSQADPVSPGNPWFAIPNTAPEYKEMIAALLLAKAADRPVIVITTGTYSTTCLAPQVLEILVG